MQSIHHVAVSVTDFEKSLSFYEKLGFKILFKNSKPELRKQLALMELGNFKLEVFCFEDSSDNPQTRQNIGNNIREIGQKHFAIQVQSLEQTLAKIQENDIELTSQPDVGDAGYKFFFIRDPDGIWIEYVEDNKY